MSRKILAGNWKMNLTWADAQALANALDKDCADFPSDVKVIIAPPAPYLSGLKNLSSRLNIAAQNVSEHASGAFTGEWSASMLQSLGIHYCLVGHSERRSIYKESDAAIALKVKALLDHHISPIFCFGEELSIRENGTHFDLVIKQLESGVMGLTDQQMSRVILAYEPVWAIGTGRTATSAQAQEMHAFVRGLVDARFGAERAAKVSILYGGSCNLSNGEELFGCPDVDGGLIGGASLVANDFITLIKQNGRS
jgi:triosephosphate isomerase (TIM)